MLLTLLAVGCGKDEIKVYKVAKDQPSEPSPSASASPSADSTAAGQSQQPHIHWENLPEHWQEEPASRMRVASFSISGDGQQQAEVSVVPLQGVSGIARSSVNMWRNELGLPNWNEEEFTAAAEMIQIGAHEAMLFDLAGSGSSSESGESAPSRIIGAVLPHQSTTWFFKMSGDDPLVTQEKSNFLALLETVEFHGPQAHTQMSSSAPGPGPTAPPTPQGGPVSSPSSGSGGSGLPEWEVPSGWEEQPPGSSMILAKFAVGGNQGGGQAEVTVTAFPGDVGGLLANINRWRRQVQLPPISQSELSEYITSLDLDGREATLADITGAKPEGSGEPATRIVAGIVPHAGKTWFFKLMGAAPAVAAEKDALIEFVKSVRYPDAP